MRYKWNSLIEAVEEFLRITTGKGFVSIITFDLHSKIIVEHVPIHCSLVSLLKYSGKGTNFKNPMKNVFQILKQRKNLSNESIYFLFMSDGYAGFPDSEIKEIKKLNIPLHFYAISFGKPSSTLQKVPNVCETLQYMAYIFKGSAREAFDEEMLLEAYSTIGYEIVQPLSQQ